MKHNDIGKNIGRLLSAAFLLLLFATSCLDDF